MTESSVFARVESEVEDLLKGEIMKGQEETFGDDGYVYSLDGGDSSLVCVCLCTLIYTQIYIHRSKLHTFSVYMLHFTNFLLNC